MLGQIIKFIIFISPIVLFSQDIDLGGTEINSFFFQDSKDNIWVSDLYGWNKFNGTSTIQYSTKNLKSGIKGSYIQSSLFEDSEGTLWGSTYEYIIKYSPSDDKLNSYQITHNKELKTSGYHLFNYDKVNNNLWLSINNELVIVNVKSLEIVASKHSKLKSRRFLVYHEVTTNRKKVIGFPWNENNGFEIFNIYEDNTIEYQNSYFTNSNYSFKEGIQVGSTIWLVIDPGIIEFDLKSQKSLGKHTLINSKTSIKHIDLLNNKFYVTTGNKGLWEFNLSSREFKKVNLKTELINQSPREIFIDKFDAIWLSFRNKGVQRIFLDSRSETLNQLPFTKDLPINRLLNIDSNTNLIATESIALYFVDSTSTTKNIELYRSAKFPITNIQDIRYSEENLYLMDLKKIYKYNIINESTQLIYKINEGQLFFLEEDQNHNLIVSSSRGVHSISQDGTSKMLNDESEYCFDDVHVKVIPFKYSYLIFDGNQSDSLFFCNSSALYAIDEIGWLNSSFIDNEKGKAYLSTQKGLYTFDDKQRFKRIFPILENYDDLDITGFTIDDGNYWITSKNKIYHISSDKNILRIPIFEELTFANTSPLVLKDYVLFGTDKGVFRLDKNITQELRSIPNLQLKKIKHENEELDLNKTLNSNTITLPYSKLSMDIQFDISEYFGDDNLSLQYQLNGYDQHKQYSKDGLISYANLAPGNYELTASAIGSNRKFSEEQIFTIKISPPYHQTWWFRSLIALGLLGIGFGFNYFRTKQQLKEKQIELDRQKALQEQRNRMSRDLHDEMGSGLTKIKYLTQSVNAPEEIETSKQIDNLATNLIGNMRELLWSLDEGYDSSTSLFAKLRETINQYNKNADLNIILEKNAGFQKVQISGLVRRNIVLIVKECLTNVLKHAKASEVMIKAKTNESELIISIKDNGIGFNPMTPSKSGKYGLNSIKRRITDLNGTLKIESNSNGTTILLTVSHLGLLLK